MIPVPSPLDALLPHEMARRAQQRRIANVLEAPDPRGRADHHP